MVKILIAGDFAPIARVAQLINNGDYSTVFSEVKTITDKVDYSIVNLESPIVISSLSKRVHKYGPHLKCTPNAAKAIKYAGFDMVTLANNHFYDYGEEGVRDTIQVCKDEELDIVGGGLDLGQASKTFYKEIRGVRFAIINCCEHEFSIATETSGGANPINPIQQYYAIKEAKLRADKVIVIVHGGHEHHQLPSPRMKEAYRFYVDAGADVVVNHHQHCYSGYEIYKGAPIFYGLGNFCFDAVPQRNNSSWNKGYMVQLNFGKEVSFDIFPYIQCDEQPRVQILPVDKFSNDICRLNTIIADDKQLQVETVNYYQKSFKWESTILEPYKGKIMIKLLTMGLLPRFIKFSKASQILNHIECESHRDKILYTLKKIVK